MAKTIQEIQQMITDKYDKREVINEIADFLEALSLGQVPGLGLLYKSYTAIINQTGTNAPIATELFNNTGADFVYSRDSAGVYDAILSVPVLTEGKTIIFLGSSYTPTLFYGFYYTFNNSFQFYQTDLDGATTDNILNLSIEVRIYP